jgi:hypothetical protein
LDDAKGFFILFYFQKSPNKGKTIIFLANRFQKRPNLADLAFLRPNGNPDLDTLPKPPASPKSIVKIGPGKLAQTL